MKIIKLHKLHNVRDLGGIKTSDGRLIKDKILFDVGHQSYIHKMKLFISLQ